MKTSIPEETRKEIILELIWACLHQEPGFSATEAGSLWQLIKWSIFPDNRPYSRWQLNNNIKTVQWIKKNHPDIYSSIRPWITLPSEEELEQEKLNGKD